MDYSLGDGFLSGFAASALRHDGVMKAASEALWELVKLIVTVDFNGFLGRIHDHVAFFAPM